MDTSSFSICLSWSTLSDEHKEITETECKVYTEEKIILWEQCQASARQESEKLGVQFMEDVNKEAFFKKVQLLIGEFKEDPKKASLIDKITALKG